tara:strand:- start:231 stop:827 length:597 start_codon:yes stop_codon:yes gene_type:complete
MNYNLLNLIGEAYNVFDSLVMKGVNVGVKAWNWTTGETKTQLSNKLWTLAAVSGSLNESFKEEPSAIPPAIYILLVHRVHNANNWHTEKEEKALKDGLKDTVVELRKSYLGIAGMFLGATSLNSILEGFSKTSGIDKTQDFILGSSNAFASLGCYVMRADSLPPRKDCVTRGLEKLAEFRKEKEMRPAFIPQLYQPVE